MDVEVMTDTPTPSPLKMREVPASEIWETTTPLNREHIMRFNHILRLIEEYKTKLDAEVPDDDTSDVYEYHLAGGSNDDYSLWTFITNRKEYDSWVIHDFKKKFIPANNPPPW